MKVYQITPTFSVPADFLEAEDHLSFVGGNLGETGVQYNKQPGSEKKKPSVTHELRALKQRMTLTKHEHGLIFH